MSTVLKRMNAEDRREQILAAATEVFGTMGFEAGTTDTIARVAGISQAYVVRTFGSKEALVLEVTDRACSRVRSVFRSVTATFTGDETVVERQHRMGEAYQELIKDRGLLLSLMHVFSAGHDPVLGPVARERFLDVYRIVRDEAGLAAPDATAFMAQGMLINTLMAMRLQDSDDSDATELTACGFGVEMKSLDQVRSLLGEASDFTSRR
jgi:TetR/AcrR family transcriptional regulator